MSRPIGSIRYHLRWGPISWIDNALFASVVILALIALSQ